MDLSQVLVSIEAGDMCWSGGKLGLGFDGFEVQLLGLCRPSVEAAPLISSATVGDGSLRANRFWLK